MLLPFKNCAKIKVNPIIRSDGGKENTVIQLAYLSSYPFVPLINNNESFGNNCMIGTSVANPRVESTWGRIRNMQWIFGLTFLKWI